MNVAGDPPSFHRSTAVEVVIVVHDKVVLLVQVPACVRVITVKTCIVTRQKNHKKSESKNRAGERLVEKWRLQAPLFCPVS